MAEKYTVSLTDLQGREVVKKETVISTSYNLDISSLKEGAYLLKLQNGKKTSKQDDFEERLKKLYS